MNIRRRRQSRGFTLMEVMLVMAILIIIASLATYSILVFQRNAQEDSTRLTISSLERGCEAYQLDVGFLPNQLNDLIIKPSGATSKWRGPYLNKDAIPNDAWNAPFEYKQTTDQNTGLPKPIIRSNGLDRQQGTADDISNIAQTNTNN